MSFGSDKEKFRKQALELMKAKAGWMIGIGLVMIVLGAAAALLPHIATLSVVALVAYVLIIGGVATLLKGINGSTQGSRLGEMVLGLLYLIVGVLLLVQPAEGVLALTLILAVYFLVDGVLRIYLAFRPESEGHRFWPTIGGICSLILGAIIIAGYPFDSVWILGLLVGINLFFAGFGMLTVGIKLKQS